MNTWQRIKHLFEDDVGEFPDIVVEDVSSEQIIVIYEWLMMQCGVAHDPKLWSFKRKGNASIHEIYHPEREVGRGRFEDFLHYLSGLCVCDVELPDFAVAVEEDILALDYKAGAGWNETKVLALFELLRQVQKLAPSARIFQTYEGGCRPNIEFSEEFNAYCQKHDS